MTTATIHSTSRENVTHQLYIHNEKAVGCTCEARQYNSTRTCRHMREFNEQIERDQQFTSLMSQFDVRSKQQAKDADRTAYNYYCLAVGI